MRCATESFNYTYYMIGYNMHDKNIETMWEKIG